jgi:tellurite resistance protein TehA-like permease
MPVLGLEDKSHHSALDRLVNSLPGSSFAFVMATGIVSIAAGDQGYDIVAAILFGINLIAFPLLSASILLRLLRHRSGLASEFTSHETGPGFLTIIAAVAVLGSEFAVQTNYVQIAKMMWIAAWSFWLGLIYSLFFVLATRAAKPPLQTGINGSWLLVAVATEALAVLGTHVATAFARPDIIMFACLCGFLLGGFFYVVIIIIIILRWLFELLSPEELTPPYWINMGAMAIVTLAGSRLESTASANPLVAKLLPAVATATVLSWAVATWWIPLLLALMVWRHRVRGVPLRYRSDNWSAVFPLGMYAAATWNLGSINHVEFVFWIPRIFIWTALAAWLGSFYGMTRRIFARSWECPSRKR